MSKYFVMAYNDFEEQGGFGDCQDICNDLDSAVTSAVKIANDFDTVDIYSVGDDNKPTLVKFWEGGEEIATEIVEEINEDE